MVVASYLGWISAFMADKKWVRNIPALFHTATTKSSRPNLNRSSRPNSILEAWSCTLRKRSGDAGLRDLDGAVVRTFAQGEEEARALEREFEGWPAESVVAVQIGNSASWPAVLLALWR